MTGVWKVAQRAPWLFFAVVSLLAPPKAQIVFPVMMQDTIARILDISRIRGP